MAGCGSINWLHPHPPLTRRISCRVCLELLYECTTNTANTERYTVYRCCLFQYFHYKLEMILIWKLWKLPNRYPKVKPDQLLQNFAEKILVWNQIDSTQLCLNFCDKNSVRYLTKQSVRNESFMKFQDICTNLWFISNLHKKGNFARKPSVFIGIKRTYGVRFSKVQYTIHVQKETFSA
jgi:hypothetical protein